MGYHDPINVHWLFAELFEINKKYKDVWQYRPERPSCRLVSKLNAGIICVHAYIIIVIIIASC
jgi:hypothetical protein